jgi:hypothetical protein
MPPPTPVPRRPPVPPGVCPPEEPTFSGSPLSLVPDGYLEGGIVSYTWTPYNLWYLSHFGFASTLPQALFNVWLVTGRETVWDFIHYQKANFKVESLRGFDPSQFVGLEGSFYWGYTWGFSQERHRMDPGVKKYEGVSWSVGGGLGASLGVLEAGMGGALVIPDKWQGIYAFTVGPAIEIGVGIPGFLLEDSPAGGNVNKLYTSYSDGFRQYDSAEAMAWDLFVTNPVILNVGFRWAAINLLYANEITKQIAK